MKAILLIALFVYSVSGATYYVATTGNNAGSGTIGDPWKDIRYGVLQMASSDILNIRGGTYGSYLYDLQEIPSGTPANPTTIQAYLGEHAIYQPDTTTNHGIYIDGKTNIVLNGIDLNAVNQFYTGLKLTGGSANILVTNCIIRNTASGQGVLITPQNSGTEATSNRLTHCSIINNGWNPAPESAPLHQIYIQSSVVTVENCYIEGATNSNLGIHHFTDDGWGCIYRNNYITNNSTGIGIMSRGTNNYVYNNIIVGGRSWAVQMVGTTNCFVLNNTCYTNNGGIDAEGGCKNITIENNICAADYGSFITIDVNGVNTASVQNNLAYGNFYSGGRGSDFDIRNGVSNVTTNANKFGTQGDFGAVVTNSTTLDAKFLGAATGDFHLTSGSDAISAGKTETLFVIDYAGSPRYAWDIGAYTISRPQATANTLHAGTLRSP